MDLRIRYAAREATLGPRSSTWRIYDRERACWPVLLPALGLKVPQRFDTEGEAQAWADEYLNPPPQARVAVAAPAGPKRTTTRKGGKP